MNAKRFEPCPFCGEYPQMEGYTSDGTMMYQVACENERCMIQPMTPWRKNMAQATRDWNRRV